MQDNCPPGQAQHPPSWPGTCPQRPIRGENHESWPIRGQSWPSSHTNTPGWIITQTPRPPLPVTCELSLPRWVRTGHGCEGDKTNLSLIQALFLFWMCAGAREAEMGLSRGWGEESDESAEECGEQSDERWVGRGCQDHHHLPTRRRGLNIHQRRSYVSCPSHRIISAFDNMKI